MNEALVASLINGVFQLASVGVERQNVLARVEGVPAEQIPSILDAMFIESVARRDEAIKGAHE